MSVEALSRLIGELPDHLRRRALTHASWTDDRIDSYERLALLGDSVLGLSVADELYRRFPDRDAGELTKLLNQTVSGASCAIVGEQLGIAAMLCAAEPDSPETRIPAKVLLDGGRPLPEITEAMIGACFIGFGFEPASAAVADAFGPRIEHADSNRLDFKSALQETMAARHRTVTYEVVGEQGPPHQRIFEVAALADGVEIGRGSGRSKKTAGQAAAAIALEEIDA